jgi:hypothetical protein
MNPPWTNPETTSWIQEQLNRLGLEPTGPIDQPHLRPWSTVLKVPTNDGDLFFKATTNEPAHEVALTNELQRIFPQIIPEIIAADDGRCWMLMRDGGDSLRAVLKRTRSLKHWEKILPMYAELQIQLIKSVELFLEMGVPDRRLSIFPELLAGMLADDDSLLLDHQDGISSTDRGRILAGNVSHLCSALAMVGIPESLDHGDFHDGNIFLNRSKYVFFDWGDSSVTHPFFSLRTAFVSVENTFDLEEDAPQFTKLADAYLEPWEMIEDRPKLREGFDLARRLWSISSAFRWHLEVTSLPAEKREPYAAAVPSLLHEYLDANPELP